MIGEHQLGLAVGNLSSEQGHDRDPPGDHGVDGNRLLQPVGGAGHISPVAGRFHPLTQTGTGA